MVMSCPNIPYDISSQLLKNYKSYTGQCVFSCIYSSSMFIVQTNKFHLQIHQRNLVWQKRSLTTLPPADLVCNAWIFSETMRRIRKSIHNLASAVASSFSPNSGQYLAGFAQGNGFSLFGISFLRSCSICLFTTWLLIPPQREWTDISLSAKRISKQINPNTHITNISIFCFVLYNFCSISVCCTWCTSNTCALTSVGWHFSILEKYPTGVLLAGFPCISRWSAFTSRFHCFEFLCVIKFIWESSQNWIFQGCSRDAAA